jgi:hypothetical protein
LKEKLEVERAERATTRALANAQALQIDELTGVRAQEQDQLRELREAVERERSQRAETTTAFAARESTLAELMTELERERAESANVVAAHEATLSELYAELEVERAQSGTCSHDLAGIEATLAEVQAEVERKQLQITASTKALTAREAAHVELQAELERERSARSWLAAQLAAAEAGRAPSSDPESSHRRIEASQQEQLDTLRACLLELRLPLAELETELGRIARGEGRTPHNSAAAQGLHIDPDTLSALDEQLRQKDGKIEELEAALAAERQARVASPEAEREARAAARDVNVATLKGELIDVRANATRLSDDLTKERTRRRKMAVTVRALQAASESGEAPGPWIEELIALINEGTSIPPKT